MAVVRISPSELKADLRNAESSIRALVVEADEVEQERLNAKANAVSAGARRLDIELEKNHEKADTAYCSTIEHFVQECEFAENAVHGDKYHQARLLGKSEGCSLVLEYVRRSR